MKTGSILILSSLAVIGAAGVYTLSRDPAEQTADNPRNRTAQGGGGVSTLGEVCSDVRDDLANILDQQTYVTDRLEQLSSLARSIAAQYRAERKSGRSSWGARREQGIYDYIMSGTARPADDVAGDSRVSSAVMKRVEDLHEEVKRLRSRLDTYESRLIDLENEEAELIGKGVC